MKSDDLDDKIILYKGNNGQLAIRVLLENETVWFLQAQLVDLYQSSKANISEHIKHIFEDKELNRNSVVRKFRTTASDGKKYEVEHYNLDLIISLGYRVKSDIATKFWIWATARIREYIVKGFTMDDERLKEAGGGNLKKYLLVSPWALPRWIRLAVVFTKVKDIFWGVV